MANISCPHCQQLINSQAITCPHCRITLKAYGHPGIILHRATDGYLCDTCTYHADNSCTFPKYPHAKDCTLYENLQNRQLELQQEINISFNIKLKRWLQRYQALLLLAGLLLICFVITILT